MKKVALKEKNSFKEKVFKIVKKIPKGSFLSYKKVAILLKNKNAYRAVANVLARNNDLKVPCHRVIKNNNEIGGYRGSLKNSFLKAALLLKEGAVGVILTDTLYGICGSALNKKTVNKIYRLRKRNPKKPMIILISSLKDLKHFGIKLNSFQKNILTKIWPSRISVILKCESKKFFYLHRGLKTLAFRLPKDKELIKILEISGPLVAPSANLEGEKPAETINEARKYFLDKVFYYNKGKRVSLPSTIVNLQENKIKVLRKGADFKKIKFMLK